jgi:hypothetical protein
MIQWPYGSLLLPYVAGFKLACVTEVATLGTMVPEAAPNVPKTARPSNATHSACAHPYNCAHPFKCVLVWFVITVTCDNATLQPDSACSLVDCVALDATRMSLNQWGRRASGMSHVSTCSFPQPCVASHK